MIDSADMEQTGLTDAARALSDALGALERALDPMLARLSQLETQVTEAGVLSEDRARLAAELDDALEARRVREAEFETLSRQTRAELDATISTLRNVLQGGAEPQGDGHG